MTYSPLEEFFSAFIHGIGAFLSVAMLTILVIFGIRSGSVIALITFVIFGVSMMAVFLTSTFYHAATDPEKKITIKRIDHIVIYYLIAGTYTPFCLVSLGGVRGWLVFSIIWALAIFGTILKIILPPTAGAKLWSVGLYLLMGWLAVFTIPWFINTVPPVGLIYLLIGGLSYTVGVVFYALKKVRYTHAIWHLFVLGGAIMHFFAVLYAYIIPEI